MKPYEIVRPAHSDILNYRGSSINHVKAVKLYRCPIAILSNLCLFVVQNERKEMRISLSLRISIRNTFWETMRNRNTDSYWNKHQRCRQRLKTIGILIFVILLGLGSRKFPSLTIVWLGKYPGDALWAIMVFYMVLLIQPTCKIDKAALVALSISFIDEFSQLYHQPHLDHFRATTIGHLILGSQFSWMDLLAYTAGIFCVFGIEKGWTQYKTQRKRDTSPKANVPFA